MEKFYFDDESREILIFETQFSELLYDYLNRIANS